MNLVLFFCNTKLHKGYHKVTQRKNKPLRNFVYNLVALCAPVFMIHYLFKDKVLYFIVMFCNPFFVLFFGKVFCILCASGPEGSEGGEAGEYS
jgi:hypothetical protein